MKTPIYVKMDALGPLLLSESVCRQLGIVEYHLEVKAGKDGTSSQDSDCRVPAVRVQLVNGVKLPPGSDQSVVAEVSWRQDNLLGPLLLEPDPQIRAEQKVDIADALVSSSCAGTTMVVLTNYLGFSQELEASTYGGWDM